MAGSPMRAMVLALPVLLVGSLALFVPGAQERATSLCAIPVSPTQDDERLDAAQVSNARILVAVAEQLELPRDAPTVAVATAMQASRLRNLASAEGGGVGLFRQRPSTRWGSFAELTDPVRAATTFYGELTRLDRWQQLPVGVAAQKVQRSGPSARYAGWETFAAELVSRLSGGILTDTCAVTEPVVATGTSHDLPPEAMGPEGLTPRTRFAALEIVRSFGVTEIGGFCPGGCTSGHVEGSDHYTGHAVDIMLLPISGSSRRTGDRIAAWLVANADPLALKYVIWHDQIWSIDRSREGWRKYAHPSGANSPTLRHLDHVHVSIR